MQIDKFIFNNVTGGLTDNKIIKDPAIKENNSVAQDLSNTYHIFGNKKKEDSSSETEESEITIVEVLPVVYSETELEEQKKIAYTEGYNNAIKVNEIEKEFLENKILEITDKIKNHLALIDESLVKQKIIIAQEINIIAFAIAKKIAGNLVKENKTTHIEELIKKTLPLIIDEPEINIYLNETIINDIEKRISDMKFTSGFTGTINIKSDNSLSDIDCKLEWQTGYIKNNLDNLIKEIENLINL